jgi:hypothetical protein
MEQLVVLLVIAAISLVNWLIERSGKLREQRRLEKEATRRTESASEPRPNFPYPSAREEIEEQMRRVMESFGFPIEEPKPLPLQQTPIVTLEAPPTPPPPLPNPSPAVGQPRPRRSKDFASVSCERSPWFKRLDSPQGLREALVLREILGPPKALCEL